MMNNPRILVQLGTNNRIIDGVIDHASDKGRHAEPEIVGKSAIKQRVTKLMMRGSRLYVETESGDVWPASHADHRDYDYVALAE